MVSLIRQDIQRGREGEAGNTNTLVFNLCAPSLEHIESLLSLNKVMKYHHISIFETHEYIENK